MPRNWQKIEAGPIFKGELQRRQSQVEDPTYWAELHNIDGYGGTLGKRPGIQIVNGYGTYTLLGSTTTVLQVADATGFSPASFIDVNGDSSARVASTSNSAPGTITLMTPIATAPPAGVFVVQTLIQFPGPIDTLFQAQFRNKAQFLYAAIHGMPYTVIKQGYMSTMPWDFPVTATASVTGPLSGAPTIMQVASVNGITIGDWIVFPTIDPNHAYQVTLLASGPPSWTPTSLVVSDQTFPTLPPNTPINLVPPRIGTPDPLPEFVQYANHTHFTAGMQVTPPINPAPSDATKKVPTPPQIIEQQPPSNTLHMRRHGIKPPFNFSLVAAVTPPTGSTDNNLTPLSNYEYRYRFYNSHTGQESEGSFPAQIYTGPVATGGGGGSTFSGQLTMVGSPDPQVDQIRVYRTTANGGGAWYRVLQVRLWSGGFPDAPTSTSQNVTVIPNPGANQTIWADDFSADETLGSQMRDLMDFTIPDTVSVLGIWSQANRLIGLDTGTNSVVYSDQPDIQTGAFKGEAWPLNNQIFVSYDDGDVLTGLAAFVDAVLIFKQHSVWRITGIPPDIQVHPVHFRQDLTAAGALSHRSIVVDHDDVLFRGTDAIYMLNRYDGGIEGFQSQRVSLSIDDVLQDSLNSTEVQVVPHAVFFRYKRQYRVWLTSQRAMQLQFDAGPAGEATGWSEIVLSEDLAPALGNDAATITCSCIARFDPVVFRGNINASMLVSPLDSGVFLGTKNGVVLQMDVGQADFGFSYTVRLRSLRFAPAGRGIGSRIRALDWQVSPINTATPTISFFSDQLTSPVPVVMTVPRPTDTFPTPQPPNTVDIIHATEDPYMMYSTLVIVPGHLHSFTWQEKDPSSMYRVLGWTLWFQALTQATVRRSVIQTLPEPMETEPVPPVTQG